MKKQITKDIFKERWKLRRYLRRKPNGCLEYVGPNRGGSEGNPLLSIKNKNGKGSSIHLRTWVWIKHGGQIPEGLYPHMRCNNYRCIEYRHMELLKDHRAYRHKKNEFLVRLPIGKIRNILYYKGKVPGTVIGKVTNLPPHSVQGIWHNKQLSSILSDKPGWRPNLAFETLVETACIPKHTVYLGKRLLEVAKTDIGRSRLNSKQKDLALAIVSGETAASIAGKIHKTFGGVLFLYRKAMVALYRENDGKRWIRIASKDRIRKWDEKMRPGRSPFDLV